MAAPRPPPKDGKKPYAKASVVGATVFWLLCPNIARYISGLESRGAIRDWTSGAAGETNATAVCSPPRRLKPWPQLWRSRPTAPVCQGGGGRGSPAALRGIQHLADLLVRWRWSLFSSACHLCIALSTGLVVFLPPARGDSGWGEQVHFWPIPASPAPPGRDATAQLASPPFFPA